MLCGLFSVSIFPLLILAICAAVVWRALVPPLGAPPRPACERCRYPVVNLTTFVCPECGSDLRRVGIITRAMEMRRRGSTAGAIAAWTVIVFLIGAIAAWIVAMTGLMSTAAAGGSTMQQAVSLVPGSGAYRSLDLDVARDYARTPPATGLSLSLTRRDGGVAVMKIDTQARTCITYGADGEVTGTGALDEPIVAQWLTQNGIDTTDADVAREVKEIVRVAEITIASPWIADPSQMGLTSLRSLGVTMPAAPRAQPRRAPFVAVLAVGVVIWILGIAAIVWRRRVLLAMADSVEAQTLSGAQA